MMLFTHEIQPADVRHLHCTDPRVAEEVAAVNRSLHRLEEGIPTWCYLEREPVPASKAEAAA